MLVAAAELLDQEHLSILGLDECLGMMLLLQVPCDEGLVLILVGDVKVPIDFGKGQ